MSRRHTQYILSLILIYLTCLVCSAEINKSDGRTSGGRFGERSAFFALRSCHQHLRSDSGVFFSPDYLCSNPPVWCNWTLQVTPGKRVLLELEDLAPTETCGQKRDQLHLDEAALAPIGQTQRVLEGCWRRHRYTSVSDTLQVVLLIRGGRDVPYRGFYGTFSALAPEENEEVVETVLHEDEDYEDDDDDDYYDEASASTEAPSALSDSTDTPLTASGYHGDKDNDNLDNDEDNLTAGGQQIPPKRDNSQTHFTDPTLTLYTSITPTVGTETGRGASRRNVDAQTPAGARQLQEEEYDEEDGIITLPVVRDSQPKLYRRAKVKSPQYPSSSNISYSSQSPGELLLEVSVELSLKPSYHEESSSLKNALDVMVREALGRLPLKSLDFKRQKKLSSGFFFIIWLWFERTASVTELQSHLLRIQGQTVQSQTSSARGIIASVSTEDINECATQMVLCDPHSECVNQFGSYSCRCLHGYSEDHGMGTRVCVKSPEPDCSWTSSPIVSQGIYTACGLLLVLIMLLLLVLLFMYRRYHRGVFDPHCNKTSLSSVTENADDNNNRNNENVPNPSLFPPPPPPRELPLLSFSSLAPSEGFRGKIHSQKHEF